MKSPFKLLGLALLAAFSIHHPNIAKADSVALQEFGVCSHPLSYSATDTSAACDEIIASGVKWVRTDCSWAWLSQTKGPYPGSLNQSRLIQMDDMLNRLNAKGVQIDFIFGNIAGWASSIQIPTPDILAKPANWQDWSDFVRFIVTRYKIKVTHWEIWNEPDYGNWHGSDQDYVTLLQKASVEIRAVDSNNKVLMGGLACVGAYDPSPFFESILGLGAAQYFDIINYHSYGPSKRRADVFAGIQNSINRFSLQSRKIWITETGFTTGGYTSMEQAKAEYVENAYYSLFSMSPNMEKVFMYVDRNTNIGDANQDNYGFVTNATRTPLPAFHHYLSVGGAETNFVKQKSYPNTESRRTLNYVVTATGDGSFVTDDVADGSSKRIAAGTYMYFKLNDAWMYNNISQDQPIYVDVTYWNAGTGQWGLQYDGASNSYQNIQQARTPTSAWAKKTFTLTDAKFANRENNTSDFRLYGLTTDLIVQTVAVRRSDTVGWAALAPTGTTDQGSLMWRMDYATGEGSNPVAIIGGRYCRQIQDNLHYIYFDVTENLVLPTDKNVTITVTFWDAGFDSLVLSYNAIGNFAKSFRFAKTNTNAWRTQPIALTDANFVNGLNNADFRFGNNWDGSVEYISDVKVTSP